MRFNFRVTSPPYVSSSGYRVEQVRVIDFLFITARVAKRAKVMFLQACVTHSVQWGGGGGNETPKVCEQHLPPPRTRSQHLPPPQDQVTTPPSPPGTRSQHLPPPSPWDQVTIPPPPLTRSQHLPNSPGTRSQHLPSPPRDQVRTPPSPRDQVTTSPSPLGLCAGGRYASYCNASLFNMKTFNCL